MSENSEIITSLNLNPTVPFDPMVSMYINQFGIMEAEYFNGWEAETMSWKKTCYISANLSFMMAMHTVKGPDAEKLMNEWFVNNFSTMKPGSVRHGIMVTEKGHVIEHGIVLRLADDAFGLYAFQPYINWIAASGKYDVELEVAQGDFIFQVAGPRSLEVLEHAAEEDLHDIKFMKFRNATIAGHEVRVTRQGMAGTLSYEVHGPVEIAQDVYNKIVEAGQPYGIEKLGYLAYQSNHSENGYPQIGMHFPYAFAEEEEFSAFLKSIGFFADPAAMPTLGSMPDDMNCYYKNPFELGWGGSVKFDHDFHGKEALLKIAENHREMVTLIWEPEDVIDIFASQFDKENQPYKNIALPYDHRVAGYGNVQYLVQDALGNEIGCAMWPNYTLYSRDFFSIATIEPEFAEIGSEVTVVWGDTADRKKLVRARVAKFPLLDLTPNYAYDVETIPHYEG